MSGGGLGGAGQGCCLGLWSHPRNMQPLSPRPGCVTAAGQGSARPVSGRPQRQGSTHSTTCVCTAVSWALTHCTCSHRGASQGVEGRALRIPPTLRDSPLGRPSGSQQTPSAQGVALPTGGLSLLLESGGSAPQFDAFRLVRIPWSRSQGSEPSCPCSRPSSGRSRGGLLLPSPGSSGAAARLPSCPPHGQRTW